MFVVSVTGWCVPVLASVPAIPDTCAAILAAAGMPLPGCAILPLVVAGSVYSFLAVPADGGAALSVSVFTSSGSVQ